MNKGKYKCESEEEDGNMYVDVMYAGSGGVDEINISRRKLVLQSLQIARVLRRTMLFLPVCGWVRRVWCVSECNHVCNHSYVYWQTEGLSTAF